MVFQLLNRWPELIQSETVCKKNMVVPKKTSQNNPEKNVAALRKLNTP